MIQIDRKFVFGLRASSSAVKIGNCAKMGPMNLHPPKNVGVALSSFHSCQLSHNNELQCLLNCIVLTLSQCAD